MGNPYRILAVDDEKFNLLLLESCLKGEYGQLVTCDNAQKALGEFKRGTFDVVLLDILMADIDGFEVRQLIREYNRKVPIIFLTSLLDDINSTLVNRITEDQYSYYLNKSFNKKTLLAKIEQAVHTYREDTANDHFVRKIEADLALAGEVQKIMLPNWCEINRNMLTSYLYEPAFRVSGDLFEFLWIDANRCLCVIGDISGHGIQAALYMSAIQSFLKIHLAECRPSEIRPHQVLNRLNAFVEIDLKGENYMTCLVAIFDFKHNHLTFHNAGHPGLIGCSPSRGEAYRIVGNGAGGIPVGWSRNYVYAESENVEFDFENDTIFIGCTDGIFDLTRPNEPGQNIGEESVLKFLSTLAPESDVVAIPFQLRNALEQIGYTGVTDDVFIMALQKNDPDSGWFSRFMIPRTAEVSNGVIAFGQFVQEQTDDLKLATQVELLLSEFLNNIILHGLKGQPVLKAGIAIRLQVQAEKIAIRVMDRGRQWECDQLLGAANVEAELERLNEARATSGRGMAIILNIADSISRKHFRGVNETVFFISRPH